MEYKQVILLRKDLKLPLGKACSQCSHAAVESALKADKKIVDKWRLQGAKKVALKVDNEKDLLFYFQEAKNSGIAASLITDAGRTVIAPGTKTVVGIGPDEEEKIDRLTGKLKIY